MPTWQPIAQLGAAQPAPASTGLYTQLGTASFTVALPNGTNFYLDVATGTWASDQPTSAGVGGTFALDCSTPTTEFVLTLSISFAGANGDTGTFAGTVPAGVGNGTAISFQVTSGNSGTLSQYDQPPTTGAPISQGVFNMMVTSGTIPNGSFTGTFTSAIMPGPSGDQTLQLNIASGANAATIQFQTAAPFDPQTSVCMAFVPVALTTPFVILFSLTAPGSGIISGNNSGPAITAPQVMTGETVALSARTPLGTYGSFKQTIRANGLLYDIGGSPNGIVINNPGTPAVVPVVSTFKPGELIPFAGPGIPAGGWLQADGSTYQKTAYPDLATAIGTAFGGSGTTFKVPYVPPLGVGRPLPPPPPLVQPDVDTLGFTLVTKSKTFTDFASGSATVTVDVFSAGDLAGKRIAFIEYSVDNPSSNGNLWKGGAITAVVAQLKLVSVATLSPGVFWLSTADFFTENPTGKAIGAVAFQASDNPTPQLGGIPVRDATAKIQCVLTITNGVGTDLTQGSATFNVWLL